MMIILNEMCPSYRYRWKYNTNNNNLKYEHKNAIYLVSKIKLKVLH